MVLVYSILFTGAPAPQIAQQAPKPLSAEQRRQLGDVRQHALETIEAINSILKASSFASRAELYCRFYVDQSPSFTILGVHSEKEAEGLYAKLMRTEPPTREEELRRQYQLRALRDRMAAFAENVSVCRGMVTAGTQTIPEPNQLREKLADTRKQLVEIDRDIASGAISAPPLDQTLSKQPMQDSMPVQTYRVEPEYSEAARQAKFNGTVRASIVIDEQGNVGNVRILDSPGLGLDEKVVVAVRRWRFKPAVKDGRTVPANAIVTLTFRLQ